MDGEFPADVLRAWWIELVGVLVAVVGGALALRSGRTVQVLLAAVLLAALADRIRLRMDNRSLSAQVREFQGRLREESGE